MFLPVGDGVRADAEEPCDQASVPAQEALDLEDLEALGRRVVGAVSFGDLVEASAEDIDRAVRFGLGFRYANMGVVEFIDYGGVDILHYAANYLADTLDPRYRPPAIVGQYMQEGRKGLREGRGFYDWSKVDVGAYRTEVLAKMVNMLRFQGLLQAPDAAVFRG